MKVTFIAVHKDIKGNITHIRLLDEDTKEIKDFPYNNVLYALQSKKITVNGLKVYNNKLKGSNGSIDRYPVFINGVLRDNARSIVILATIDDKAYRVCDADGRIVEATTSGLLEKRNKGLDIANGKIVEKNGTTYFSAITGTYPNIHIEQSYAKNKQIEAKNKQINDKNKQIEANRQPLRNTNKTNNSDVKKNTIKKITYNRERDPRLPKVITGKPRANSRMKELDEVTGMTLEQKMAYIILAVQTVRPFYYSILSVLKRIEASDQDGIDTMAVSLDTLYFSPQFVKDTSLSDLLFVVLHEICHVAMKHRIRECGREHDAWNYATDYYINRNLAVEFGLKEVGKKYKANKRAFSNEFTNYEISIPTFGLYNEKIDVDEDTPETIYSELYDQQQQEQQQSNQNNNQDNSSNNNSDNNSQQQSNNGQQQNSEEQQQSSNNQQGSGSEQNSNSNGQQQSNNGQQQNSNNQQGNNGEQLSNGIQQVQKGAQQASNNCNNSSESQKAQNEINDGINKVQQGMQQVSNSNKTGDSKSAEDGQKQLQQGVEQIKNGINDMNKAQQQSGQSETPSGQQASQEMQQGMNNIQQALNGAGQGNSEGSSNKEDSQNSEKNNNSTDGDSNSDKADSQGKDMSQQRQHGRFAGKEFRGQEIPDVQPDMMDDENSLGKTPEQLNQTASTLLSQAVTIHKQRNSFGGDTPDFLERYVEKALAPKVNWRSVVRRFLTKASQKEYTFAHPDRRFLGRRNADGSHQVFAGPHNADNGELENIKICIDTSGSITPKDLGQALSQIEDLFKQYKADAELLYWDTRVRAVYPFKDYKELLSKEPKGGGGTDANCIFDFFENDKEYKMHKKKQPSLIIVFTDGYFGTVENKYKRKYKNTIWIVHDNDKFKAPFGVQAPLKTDIK